MVSPPAAWRQAPGFDESYQMYCEDVDLCLHKRMAGRQLVMEPVSVAPAWAWASGCEWRHLWCSPVYRQAQNLVTAAGADALRIAGT